MSTEQTPPTSLEDISSSSFEQLTLHDRFERIRFAIESGDIKDPRILDAYFVAGEQYYVDARDRQRRQFGGELLEDWFNEGEVEMRRLQTASESEKISHCTTQGKNHMRQAEFLAGKDEQLITYHLNKSIHWYDMAAARARISLPRGSTTKGSIPPSMPSSSTGK